MKLVIVGNLGKPELPESVSTFIRHLVDEDVEFVIEEQIAGVLKEKPPGSQIGSAGECTGADDILVAFGGDGTILAAAREAGARGVPVLGINLGKLGFLAEVAPSEMKEAIKDLIDRRYNIEERLVLRGESPQMRSPIHAVNDIVLAKGRSSRMIDLNATIDGTYAVTYRGDGLILSTPTGSTAYALSNGGPIVTPMSRVIGITPISPHTLSGRPLIVPDTSEIRIEALEAGQGILVSGDGQEEAVLNSPVQITIRKAEYTLRLVKRLNRSYFDVLRAKLMWGRDPRSP